MKRKSNLDEMQELELLRIEHNGCWMAFWLLLASMILQMIVFGSGDFRILAGEWTVFMVLSLYLGFACVRKGIWDRHLKMDMKTNVVLSLIAALVIGCLNAVVIFRNYQKPVGTAVAASISAVITFIICLAVLTVMKKSVKKRQERLEEEPAETGWTNEQ